MKNLLKSILSLVGILALCACHHQNPLTTHSKQETLKFLLNASANAEKSLHIPIQKDSYGYAYLECMDGKNSSDLPCDALYLGMVSFAKEQHDSGFKHLSVKDLTDHSVYTSLAEDYAEYAATHEPHFISEKHL
ncbi:T4SS-associated protein LvrD [Legionella maioricensis]|uniref:Protein LvrD n=1 Tax=Legionella maioricensis TaxID=2896528 RepID=A0A9X2D3K7_9GAMM|nr:T4SS-associated protein LvrD [Legionella maioricensis]MCL9685739.1 protein LvrD [Legionella maioricensis]MCL9688973.1 protein LvrD [Legionella maioricensis]